MTQKHGWDKLGSISDSTLSLWASDPRFCLCDLMTFGLIPKRGIFTLHP